MKNFIVIFLLSLLENSVFGADEMKKEVTEGDSLTLLTGLTEVRSSDLIYWLYGSDDIIIAETRDGNFETFDDRADGIFKGKLELDKQTGSLTIKNIKIKNSGDYQLDINSGAKSTKFSVIVYARLPIPAIGFLECAPTPAGSSYPPCVVQCSVQTMGLVTLSWYKGNNVVDTRKSDTCSSLSLRQEVDYYDKNTYSCMVNNPISNQTKHLVISGLCQPCVGSGLSPGAVAGIVVVVLLVSAAVAAAVMYYHRPRTTKLPGQTWSVLVGDDVTLNPDTEIQTSDEIQWLRGGDDALIAGIRRETREMNTYEGPDLIFTNKPTLDETTGSLTIKLIDSEHAGLYTLKIRRARETLYKRFIVYVTKRMIRVTEGDPVTINSDTVIQTGDEIQWLFDDKEQQTVLAEIKTREVTKYEGPDWRFRDRLELNKETGSLTVTKFTAAHAGVYTLKIRRGTETSYNRFFICDKAREIEVTEGESVTLNPAAEINKDDVIRWLFRDEDQSTVIVEIRRETKVFKHDDVAGWRFKDILKLDETTGSLTIEFIRTAHSGVYKLQIISSRGVSENTFIVTVNDKVEKKSQNEGGSVTLNTNTEIQRDDQILWMFGAQDKLIAQIRGGTVEIYDDANKIFKDRLELDKTTGSLTITDTEAEHTGLYKLLTISSSKGTLCKKFKFSIQIRYMVVKEGDSVTLKIGPTGRQTDDEIQWRFGDENSLIAEIKGGTGKTHDVPDERFRDRLELNETTGDLTIKNSTAEHAGRYKVKICSSEGDTSRTFIVDIEARKKSEMKEKNDSRENRVNESATVEMPLLNGEDVG